MLISSAEKQKVYQGVRVKITVKELLQQRRALQAAAAITTTALTTGNNPQVAEPVVPSYSAPQYAYPPPNGCESSIYQTHQFPENGTNPIFYDEACPPDLCADNSYNPYNNGLCSPPVNYQTPAHYNHSAVISGSPTYASVDYEYSSQRVALSAQDFCPSSHLEPKSFYPTSEEYFTHQQYSCTSAICSIFSYMPDNMEMGPVSENGSFPEYKDYSTGLLTEDIWRGNLNECLDY
ncbi:colorectal cancer associated 2 [Hemitrygon akajei]|uniref:colorectal cancer associated 2 n=1 Tax=Hemitrygon akajei TaxID=2704970 RepID=UPI003BF9B487